MWAYAIVVFVVLLLGLFLGEWRPSRKKEILFLCLSSVVLIVFSALRATNAVSYTHLAEASPVRAVLLDELD